MREYSKQHKKAWEYDAYAFWVRQAGRPEDRAREDVQNPRRKLKQYAGYFDVAFMEGGILHYFHDIDEFMRMMSAILKPGGKMICSDFHPFTKIMDTLKLEKPTMSYFSTEICEGEMAHARFYDAETRKQIPKCRYRRYTISEILNGIIRNGFILKQFDEHPSWENSDLPGEFTAIAVKQE